MLGEVTAQYLGVAPGDSTVAPYLRLAEELDVPVGTHMGLGPYAAPYAGFPRGRAALSDPLLLEDELLRHPKLRVYVMHAGWPLADRMITLLYSHPQVYVDVGVISFWIPRKEFHGYLRRLVDPRGAVSAACPDAPAARRPARRPGADARRRAGHWTARAPDA